SRPGYTGEDGCELYAAAADAGRLWAALLEAGRADGVAPIGLGARDTLRLEMKYALYGNDIDDTTNALEAGLGWVVKPAKGEFIGRAALEKVRAEGVRRKLVGIEMVDKAVARHGYPVLKDGRRVGDVVFVELPKVGVTATAKKPFGVVESVKAVSDLFAPVSGQVVEVNTELPNAPETVNADPYGRGWMIVIAPSNQPEWAELLTAEQYEAFLAAGAH